MDDGFVYVRLVSNFGTIYVCFGPEPKDLPAEMIAAFTKAIKSWPHHDVADWRFEVNPAASMVLLRSFLLIASGIITWVNTLDERPEFYGIRLEEVYPMVLEKESALCGAGEKFAVAIREIARGD